MLESAPRDPYSTIFADITLKTFFLLMSVLFGHNIEVMLHMENTRNMVIGGGGLQRIPRALITSLLVLLIPHFL